MGLVLFLAIIIFSMISPVSKAEDSREIECLAKNIYFEARGEPFEGQLAVAFVTLNRVESPAFPGTICKVVWAPGAFSWTRDNLPNNPEDKRAYKKIYELSKHFYLSPDYADPTQGAMYYHAKSVSPCWLPDAIKLIDIGRHIFYSVNHKGGSCWRRKNK